MRDVSKNYRVISIGSSVEYYGSLNNEPFSETSSLNPNSSYAVASVAQTKQAIWYGKNYGLEKIVLTKNHIIWPNDNRYIVGDNSKIIREIIWQPRIGLK